MWNLGHFCDNNYLTLHFCFYLIDFQLNTDFQFFYKCHIGVYSNISSSRKKCKKRKTFLPFLRKTIGLNNFFTLIESKFQVSKIAKFEFKVTVHYGLLAKSTQLWPHNFYITERFKSRNIRKMKIVDKVDAERWHLRRMRKRRLVREITAVEQDKTGI